MSPVYKSSYRLVSDYGTEAAPLLGSGNRGRAILSVYFPSPLFSSRHIGKNVVLYLTY
jgi:hypothetical protein